MKIIDIELTSILDGVARLENLKANVRQSGVSIPDIQGSGDTAQAIYELASSFQELENVWEGLLDESISFFSKMENSHESLQENLVNAINKIVMQ